MMPVHPQAAVAAAGAAAAVAGIPLVGPAMALAAYGETFGALLGMLATSIYSGAGGYDIPPGLNPLVQAHAEEMVLPAPLANTIRYMASETSGGTKGGGGGGGNTHISIHAMDGASVKRVLQNNSGAVAKVARSVARDRKLRRGS